jgi:N-methylhydantoinase A
VLAPRVASVLSAWGMLATDLRFEIARTQIGDVASLDMDRLRGLYAEMEAEGRQRLAGWFDGPVRIARSADMRYGEQIFEIDVPLDEVPLDAPDLAARIKHAFERRH